MNLEISNFEKSRVLVVGDIMLDRYWTGHTGRISPEAPVPVVHVKTTDNRPGGASNVAVNIQALEAKATLLGTIGSDNTAEILTSLLRDLGINNQLIEVPNFPTITKLRVLSHNQQLIRLDFEEGFHHIDMSQLLKRYEQQLGHVDIVIISDYGKGIASCAPQLIKLAQKRQIPILVDPKGKNFSIYKNATLITPNMSEFETIVGDCKNEQEIEERGVKLLKKHNFAAILVTRGAKGMSLIEKDKPAVHIPTHAREVYDVTGAGDTVIATLATALAAGHNLLAATQLANIAAGIVVRKLGAASITRAELRQALHKHQDSWMGIVNEQQLLQEVAEAKQGNETIVMTNGCFDILHSGHIAYLEQAKSLGTKLIVAVNDDNSVARLKGPMRPINQLDQRMAVLAGLRAVDWVVAFSEDTPERVIEAVSPHILVKGGDYTAEEIAGAKHVLAHGGQVKILTFIDDQSTSAIVERIKGA